MIVGKLCEDGIAIPNGPGEDVEIFSDARVAVAV